MARYRKVDPRIWNDAKFCALSDNAKLVFFMLLTHPNMTALGAMRATVPGLADELGWQAEAFREAFREALSKGMAEHDGKACLVALPRFLKYNPPESPNVIKAWVGAVDLLPECDLKSVVIQRAKGFAEGLTEGYAKAFRDTFGKAMPNQEQEQEQEQKKNKSGASAPDPRKSFWDSAIALVGERNRNRIAKMCKSHGEDAVAAAVAKATLKQPVDPCAYIAQILKAEEHDPFAGAIL